MLSLGQFSIISFSRAASHLTAMGMRYGFVLHKAEDHLKNPAAPQDTSKIPLQLCMIWWSSLTNKQQPPFDIL